MIIDKLIEKIKETNNPTVVGLDPRTSYIPEHIKQRARDMYGATTKAVAEAFYMFNKEIIDEVADLIPAVKPQIAMYEQYGPDGLEAYIRTLEYAKEAGLIVIGDIKRSDIASTAEAYADGHIGRVDAFGQEKEVFRQDFITLNPYLGSDSITPYLKNCGKYDKGLFILVKTSNPNSGEIQDLISEGDTIYEKVGDLVSKWGEDSIGRYGFSNVGAVVGATYRAQGEALRRRMPHTFFLVPGYGAQGGTGEDVAVCFNKEGLGAIVNSSRGIIAAWQNSKYKNNYSEMEFAKASRQAVIDMRNELTSCL